MKSFKSVIQHYAPAFLAIILLAIAATAQSTTFTYQGRLSDSSTAASGTYDLGFALFDAATGGNQIGMALTRPSVNVVNGVFTVQLDFGAAVFPGANRFLEIAVKKTSDTNFTTLTPRQPITSTPYAIKSLNATNADTAATATTATIAANAQQLGGVAASQFAQNNSQAFVRNQTTQQTADFSISGTGAANIFNAGAQYNIGGTRVLGIAGANNLFAGVRAGEVNTGAQNSFFGAQAGVTNSTGGFNSFFGTFAGLSNTTGGNNSFVGFNAGVSSSTGGNNSFFGVRAGQLNDSGGNNSFFGRNAGFSNSTGGNNTVIGDSANVGAGNLSFATALGSGALVTASNTVVLGRAADAVQIPGTLTVTGAISGTTTNAQQLGGVAASQFAQNDSQAFIRNQTTQQPSANFNIDSTGTANVFNAVTQYNIGGNRVLSNAGVENLFAGIGAGNANTTGGGNTYFGYNAGFSNTESNGNTFTGSSAGYYSTADGNTFTGSSAGFNTTSGGFNTFTGIEAGKNNTTGFYNLFEGLGAGYTNTTGAFNVFLGALAGESNTAGSNNTVIGTSADVGASNLEYATALGADAVVSTSNTVVLGRNADTVKVPGNFSVSGTISGNINGAGIPNLNASNITSGTLNDGRLSSNVALINQANTFAANQTVTGNLSVSGSISGNGANLTNLGQNVTTVLGTSSPVIDTTVSSYTLIPNLTQTINIPANSTLLINTDGGILSQGAANTYSVIDVAIYVDIIPVGERRIVITNNPLPQSVGNWSLSVGQTLSAGSHTIEIRTRSVVSGSSPARVSGSSADPLLRGQLTVLIIKK